MFKLGLSQLLGHNVYSVPVITVNQSKLNRKNSGCGGIHSKRECERRRKQIAEGRLKVENGLIK